MYLMDDKNSPKPYEVFDMIAGTSAGGLIAIMLGRLVSGHEVDLFSRKIHVL